MKDIESLEKGKLLKEALKIVDQLARLQSNEDDMIDKEELLDVIALAKKLKKNRHWNLT